jgi:MscS family membrane protein
MKIIKYFFLLFSAISFAQTAVDENLKSPYQTVYTHLYFLQEDSYDVKESAKTIYGKSDEVAEEIAIKIKQILDGKGLKVLMGALPKNENYLDTVSSLEKVHKYILFPSQLPKIYVEKINGNWYYSRETANEVDRIYREVYPAGTEYLKSIIPQVGHKKNTFY